MGLALIPIAEENHFINTLTKIILFKTCERIREMTEQLNHA